MKWFPCWMRSLEILGFVSLYKAFPSPLQCLFSSLLLIWVEKFLSTTLVRLNRVRLKGRYAIDKIIFFFPFMQKIVHSVPALKRIAIWCGQHSGLSLEEADYNFISLNKSGLGKEISNFNAVAFIIEKKSALLYSYQKA